MKRLFVLCLFLLFGCSKNSSIPKNDLNNWMSANGKIKVLSATAMIDDLVGQVGREKVDHLALIVGEVDPHAYELVKGDGEKLSFAQIVFYNGLGLEHGASLRYQLQHHPMAIGLEMRFKRNILSLLLKSVSKLIHIFGWMSLFGF